MSATSVRQPPYPLGVALFGALLALGLALVAGFLSLLTKALEVDAPRTMVVATAAMLIGTGGGLCLYAGAGLYYQAKPEPLSRARDSLVWRPPLVFRIAVVVVVVALLTTAVALATTPRVGDALSLPLLVAGYVGILLACLIGVRLLVARLEADDWGIRCSNPMTTVRIPWQDVRSLEPRGKSIFSQRIVAVTKQGRQRMLWVWDPRVPVSRDAARILVAELEEVRRSATTPHPDGVN